MIAYYIKLHILWNMWKVWNRCGIIPHLFVDSPEKSLY